jgi:hypothetical protein
MSSSQPGNSGLGWGVSRRNPSEVMTPAQTLMYFGHLAPILAEKVIDAQGPAIELAARAMSGSLEPEEWAYLAELLKDTAHILEHVLKQCVAVIDAKDEPHHGVEFLIRQYRSVSDE